MCDTTENKTSQHYFVQNIPLKENENENFHPKMKMCCSFPHPQVIQDGGDYFSSVEQLRRFLAETWSLVIHQLLSL